MEDNDTEQQYLDQKQVGRMLVWVHYLQSDWGGWEGGPGAAELSRPSWVSITAWLYIQLAEDHKSITRKQTYSMYSFYTDLYYE